MDAMTGFQAIQPDKKLNNLSGFSSASNNLTNPAGNNTLQMDDYLVGNDMQLKADLQGLIQKNEMYAANAQQSVLGVQEITSSDVAHNFSNVLGDFLNNVNQKNKDAEKAVQTFATGGNIDLHSVMIAAEKSELSMQLAVQLRNKFVQAYQEISRIQV